LTDEGGPHGYLTEIATKLKAQETLADWLHLNSTALLAAQTSASNFFTAYQAYVTDSRISSTFQVLRDFALYQASIQEQLRPLLDSLDSIARLVQEQMAPLVAVVESWNSEPFLQKISSVYESYREAYAPGTFLGDYWKATNIKCSEQERLDALKRLTEKWFKNPIHPRRWPLAQWELESRAQESGTSIASELRAATVQCLLLAFADVDAEAPVGEYLRLSRSALANRLMDDLAGPGWRRRQSGSETPTTQSLENEILDDLDLEYRAEVSELRQTIIRFLNTLPETQRKAVLAKMEGRPLSNAEHQALYRVRHSSTQLLALRAAI
jgi:hypothetical protein